MAFRYSKFKKSGNQNSNWNEAHFTIEEQEEDFQIVFMATGGSHHLSDIAVDDVHLIVGEKECQALDEVQTTVTISDLESTEHTLFDTGSCEKRCSEETALNDMDLMTGRCNCHEECVEDESCCPDYRSICLKGEFYLQFFWSYTF